MVGNKEMTRMIQTAIRFAIKAHAGQCRKGTTLPYIEHPMHVGLLLAQAGVRDSVVVAGLLHDTLEDTKYTEDDISCRFGEEVLELVKAASEPERDLPWRERKHHTIEFLSTANKDVKWIALCDKYSNIVAIESDYNRIGEGLWERFNAGYEEQRWYYKSLCKALEELNEERIYQDFYEAVGRVFGE